jgi:hypothetical protein
MIDWLSLIPFYDLEPDSRLVSGPSTYFVLNLLECAFIIVGIDEIEKSRNRSWRLIGISRNSDLLRWRR